MDHGKKAKRKSQSGEASKTTNRPEQGLEDSSRSCGGSGLISPAFEIKDNKKE